MKRIQILRPWFCLRINGFLLTRNKYNCIKLESQVISFSLEFMRLPIIYRGRESDQMNQGLGVQTLVSPHDKCLIKTGQLTLPSSTFKSKN